MLELVILVAGSTGSVGSRLVQLLLEAGEDVRAIVAPSEHEYWARTPNVETAVADFDDLEALTAAGLGADRMFILVPPSIHQPRWQHNLIAAAANCDYIVKLSAFDTSATTQLTMGRWHHAGEVELSKTAIPYTVLRPQYFMQNLLANPRIFTEATLPTFIDPATPVGMIDAYDVAATTAALLIAGQPTADAQVLVPTGPRAVTVKDVAGELSRAMDRPITVDYLEPARARLVMGERGLPDWHIEDVLYICATASGLVTDTVPQLTGRSARDISEVVADFVVDNRSRLTNAQE